MKKTTLLLGLLAVSLTCSLPSDAQSRRPASKKTTAKSSAKAVPAARPEYSDFVEPVEWTAFQLSEQAIGCFGSRYISGVEAAGLLSNSQRFTDVVLGAERFTISEITADGYIDKEVDGSTVIARTTITYCGTPATTMVYLGITRDAQKRDYIGKYSVIFDYNPDHKRKAKSVAKEMRNRFIAEMAESGYVAQGKGDRMVIVNSSTGRELTLEVANGCFSIVCSMN